MVSGGEALIQITGQGGSLPPGDLRITVNGREVAGEFRQDRSGQSLVGRVMGLRIGSNTIDVSVDGKSQRLHLINYPITGPIFSGPHQLPFVCKTEIAGLGPPLDGDCSAKTVVTYLYKSTNSPGSPASTGIPQTRAIPAGFKAYDLSSSRPDDLAQTTTNEGKVVDYIVRRESGTINRAIYQIAFLHQPGTPIPDPWTVTPGWNGRLIYTFGGACRAGYNQGNVSDAVSVQSLGDLFLSSGYAVATSSLNVFGNNCDDVISAETLMMVKEHFTKAFGAPVHTIGWGGSGGSMQLHLITQNYPGLLDGIIPTLSYPDVTSVNTGVVDCSLLAHAFAASTQEWKEEQKTAVAGFSSWRTCSERWMGIFIRGGAGGGYSPGWILANSTDPDKPNCDPSIAKAFLYDPISNRSGARCSIFDNEVNVYGRDPHSGFARRPLDNVGVQYGLVAFNAGQISAEQFLQLNQSVGGYDVDGNIVAARTVADPVALRTAYRTGRINSGTGGLAITPIIDLRPYLDLTDDYHDRFRSFVTRARLMAANETADNQVILTVALKPGGNVHTKYRISPEFLSETLRLMNQWLDNITKDTSRSSQKLKVARNKPAELIDACWTPEGEKISEPQTYDGGGRCNKLYSSHSDPRIAAGSPITDDILKCVLKPVVSTDYAGNFTPEQFSRLKTIFPQGVCDYSRRGVEQSLVPETWRRY
jgi:hypothetical protein